MLNRISPPSTLDNITAFALQQSLFVFVTLSGESEIRIGVVNMTVTGKGLCAPACICFE
jgi:hypothetical protein